MSGPGQRIRRRRRRARARRTHGVVTFPSVTPAGWGRMVAWMAGGRRCGLSAYNRWMDAWLEAHRAPQNDMADAMLYGMQVHTIGFDAGGQDVTVVAIRRSNMFLEVWDEASERAAADGWAAA